jgi:lysophospholipase L1-like esterase
MKINHFVGLLVFVVLGAASVPAIAAPKAIPYPGSMAALGDSVTAGEGTEGLPGEDSWATGTNPAVNSQYLRILAANPAIKGKSYNLAEGGAVDLRPQAKQAVAKRVNYVTILVGEIDTCRGTATAKIGSMLDSTLRILTSGLPKAHVFVASTRDLARQIRVLGQNKDLRGFAICGTQVGASAAELAPLHQRFAATNKTLGQVCARYQQCRFDGGAVFKMPLTSADISSSDNYHLSTKGQHKLAEVTWKATFSFGR